MANINKFLINAPAGSGKTTTIKQKILDICAIENQSEILCITYTNRAAEELLKDINAINVKILTIHSFMSEFISIYFSHREIIQLYFDIYGEEIEKRIENKNQDENIDTSNEKYIEKYGSLDFEVIKKNIKKLNYNEMPFNSLYYGGIGHDDLLSFSLEVVKRFPITQDRISKKYKYIFIDEYQDTSSNVLEIFFNAAKENNTSLFLFGDKMQQIYKNYDGRFEEYLTEFDTSIKLRTNYRSQKKIVDLLNYIYNDSSFDQSPYNKSSNEIKPLAIVSDNIQNSLTKILEEDPSILRLYVFNKERFNSIGANELYQSLNQLEKYSFASKYSAVNALTDLSDNNPDTLMKLLFEISLLLNNFSNRKFGIVIQQIKKSKYFNKEILQIRFHKDKENLEILISKILDSYYSDIKIDSFLSILIENRILTYPNLSDIVEIEEYEHVLKTSLEEIRNLYKYLEKPLVSTQHGVKGEGHDSVCFIAEDSSNPSIKIYSFIKMWTDIEINFTDFQRTYYEISSLFTTFENKIGMKISKFDKSLFEANQSQVEKFIDDLLNKYNDNIYFDYIYSTKISDFKSKPGVTKFKNAVKINDLYGVLSAYKLFYVGCSRARKKLVLLINRSKIIGDYKKIHEKFESAGFEFHEE